MEVGEVVSWSLGTGSTKCKATVSGCGCRISGGGAQTRSFQIYGRPFMVWRVQVSFNGKNILKTILKQGKYETGKFTATEGGEVCTYYSARHLTSMYPSAILSVTFSSSNISNSFLAYPL